MTSQQRRQSSPFKPNVPPQPVGPEYYDRALELVNYFRMQGNAPFVEMGRIPSAQQHAADCLAMGISSHWDLDGLKPYMRYSRAGGCQPTTAFYWNRTEPSGITDLELMLEDGVTWLFETMGNRRVVLDSIFRKVNLGIAWNKYSFVLVVELEGDYVDFDRLPVIANNAITFARRVKKGVRLRSEDDLEAGVWSADHPRAMRVARHKSGDGLDLGQLRPAGGGNLGRLQAERHGKGTGLPRLGGLPGSKTDHYRRERPDQQAPLRASD